MLSLSVGYIYDVALLRCYGSTCMYRNQFSQSMDTENTISTVQKSVKLFLAFRKRTRS